MAQSIWLQWVLRLVEFPHCLSLQTKAGYVLVYQRRNVTSSGDVSSNTVASQTGVDAMDTVDMWEQLFDLLRSGRIAAFSVQIVWLLTVK